MNKLIKYLVIPIFVATFMLSCKKEGKKFVRVDGHFMERSDNWVASGQASSQDGALYMRYDKEYPDHTEVMYIKFVGPNTIFVPSTEKVPSEIEIK